MLAFAGRRAADSGGAALLRPHQREFSLSSPVCPLSSPSPASRPRFAAARPSICNPLPWDGPLAFVLHVDALSVLFAFMGACIGGLVLLYSIGYMAHDKSATRFYATMLVFIGGFIALVYSANLFIFYLCWEVVGLCSFTLVGFWYTNREAVNGARKVLLMTHIAGYGLLAANSGALPPRGQRVVDRSRRGAQLHRRHFRADAGGAGGQERAGSAAYVDSRSHGRAHSGERAAARRLLRQGRRLSGRAHAQLWRVAAGVGREPDVGGHSDHGRGRDVRHGADRPEAHAGLFDREPDRLHDDGPRHRHAAGDYRCACCTA